MITLADAIANGRGVERPFNCNVHPDLDASASVNVAKRLWVCYACGAKGKVDSKAVPNDREIAAMLTPERTPRIYPARWLELFDAPAGYWTTRFPDWICAFIGFGEDPLTGAGTFPVHTPHGRLAGVGRRNEDIEPRYRYPPAWSASTTLGMITAADSTGGVIALVEGIADAAACWQVGLPAFPTWGAGVHFPQRAQVATLGPRLILSGYDADNAGHAAAERDHDHLGDLAEIVRLDWAPGGGKDPAAIDPPIRLELIEATVRGTDYGARNPDLASQLASRAEAIKVNHRKE